MINVIALPLFLLWLISAYLNTALDLQQNGNPIIESNSSLVADLVVKTSSGFVRGITKTVMATKIEVFLGVMSTKSTVGSRNIKPFFTPISSLVKGLSEEEVKEVEGVEIEFFSYFLLKDNKLTLR